MVASCTAASPVFVSGMVKGYRSEFGIVRNLGGHSGLCDSNIRYGSKGNKNQHSYNFLHLKFPLYSS
jgi:hypothetical protein